MNTQHLRAALLLMAALNIGAAAGAAAPASPATAPTPAPGDTPPAGTGNSRVSVLSGEQVIQILDDTVDWYRTLGTQQQNATQPSDLLILFANRQTADKVIALAFDIARANAELLSSEANSAQHAEQASPQSLSQKQALLDAQHRSIEQEISAGRHKLATSGKDKQELEAKLPELQSELAMIEARKNLLDTMSEFTGANDPKAANANALKAQIDAISATIPTSDTKAAVSLPQTAAQGRTGVWDLATNVLRQRKKIDTIEVIDRRTAALAKTFADISAPPVKQLKAYAVRSDALASQADGANSVQLKDLRGQFDTLAWLFKQTSDILLPLSKEKVLLAQYRHNLSNWRDSARRQYHEALMTLGARLLIVVGILFAVFVLGEVWRRTVLRYAHETRRRYQLLLMRKIVMWTVVVTVIGLSFVTEISSFATFAGLLTAGLAVAMQSVLVSVVGYFFLIGKYGIRVGDRIQIGTVVGEIIDLGLVRMHLMELNQQGPLGPTGRVVAFPNLIVFQAQGGLFKHIPGVNLSWHETTLTLPVVNDYAELKQRLLTAMRAILSDYSEEIKRQTKEIVRSTSSSSVDEAEPQVQMRLSNGRMEALIRYPVHFAYAGDIDERVAQAILKVLAQSA